VYGVILNTMLNLARWQFSVLLCPSAQLLQPSIKYFSENSLLIPNSSYHLHKSSLFDFNMRRLNSLQRFVFLTEIHNVTISPSASFDCSLKYNFLKKPSNRFHVQIFYVSAKIVRSIHKLAGARGGVVVKALR
jgi:hypothetical protein